MVHLHVFIYNLKKIHIVNLLTNIFIQRGDCGHNSSAFLAPWVVYSEKLKHEKEILNASWTLL